MKTFCWPINLVLVLGLLSGVAWAAEESAHGWGWFDPLGRWLNLAILLGILIYFTREPIGRFFRNRSSAIQQELVDARRAREQAEKELATVQRRLEELDKELEEIRRQAAEEAEAERKRLIEQAELEAGKILTAVGRELDGVSRSARRELRAYAARLAVEMAREHIIQEIDAETEDRMVERFMGNLELKSGRRPLS